MSHDPTHIDIFAGCGGLTAGLHLAGWKGIFAVERNQDAFRTLRTNLIDTKHHFDWPEWLPKRPWTVQGILKHKATELRSLRGKVDLVVGGPPCQGFSMAGRRKRSDSRNRLVHSYLEFVSMVRPRAVLFENVRGFTMRFKKRGAKDVDYSQFVIEELRKIGYPDARGEIINMADFGVPQRRERFIVIASRENLASRIFDSLHSTKVALLASKGIPVTNSVRGALSDLEEKHGTVPCPDSKGFYSGVWATATTGLQRNLQTGRMDIVPDSHRFVNHESVTKKVFAALLQSAPRNKTVIGDERKQYGLKKRSVQVLDPDEAAPTITTIPDDFIHYSEPRVMTVRECARLQSFPDWFQFTGPYTTGGKERKKQSPRYTQVGNAVPPLFAEIIGTATKIALKDG